MQTYWVVELQLNEFLISTLDGRCHPHALAEIIFNLTNIMLGFRRAPPPPKIVSALSKVKFKAVHLLKHYTMACCGKETKLFRH
jgi:hypothetical protein